MSEEHPFGPVLFTDQEGMETCYRRLAVDHWQSRAPSVPVWRDESDIPDVVRKLAEEHDEWVLRERMSSRSNGLDAHSDFGNQFGPLSAGRTGVTAWLVMLSGWLLGL